MRKPNSLLWHARSYYRPSNLVLAITLSLVIGLGMSTATPVSAQGFLQSLFGIGSSRPAARPGRKIRRSKSGRAKRTSWRLTMPYRLPGYRYERTRKPRRRRSSASNIGRSGGYRTMCVRQCDGFYFPLGYGVSRSRFPKDARICRAKCNSPAKLYTLSLHQQPGDMVDLGGRSYRKTKTAFLFRKKRIAGCGCRPPAWSAAELDRHKLYELNESRQRKLARQEGDIEFLAGLKQQRRVIRFANKTDLAANAAGDQEQLQTKRFNAHRKSNEAPTPGLDSADAERAVIKQSPRLANDSVADTGPASAASSAVIGTTERPNSAEYLTDRVRNNTGQDRRRHRSKRRRLRISYDDGSVRRTRARSRSRRGVRRPAPIRIRRRAKSQKPSSGFSKLFGLGGKPKYRWPGD